MDILDYLDAATRHIPSAPVAKDFRDELYDHYLHAMEAHLSDGRSFHEARALALEDLGPADLIQLTYSPPRTAHAPVTILLLVGAWLSALLSFVYPVVFPVTVALSVAAILLQPRKKLSQVLQHHPLLMVFAAVDGLVVGTYPLWSAGPYSYWAGIATFGGTMMVVGLLMLATPPYLIWRLVRKPGMEYLTAGISSAVFALSAFLSTTLLWRLYPVSPSPNVDWYTTPSPAGVTTGGTHALWFVLLWYLGAFAVAAVVREVQIQRTLDATVPTTE